MSRPIKSAIRWTLKQASEEFGVNIQVMTRKLKSNGALPGEDKKFSTRQIFESLTLDFDLKKEQLKLVKEQSRHVAIRASILEKQTAPIAVVDKVWSDYIVDIREKIKNSTIPQSEQNSILADLSTIPVENYYVDLGKKQTTEDESDI